MWSSRYLYASNKIDRFFFNKFFNKNVNNQKYSPTFTLYIRIRDRDYPIFYFNEIGALIVTICLN